MITHKVYEVPKGEEPGSYRNLTDLSVGSDMVVWCVGSAQVLVSEDQGASWTNLFSFEPSEHKLPYSYSHRVFCKHDDVCWIASPFLSECCFTTDRGRTWNIKSLGPSILPTDIFFFDDNAGWIVGSSKENQGNISEIHQTSDGGLTWSVSEPRLTGIPIRIKFLSESTGWLLENVLSHQNSRFESNIYQSVDGGKTWLLYTSFNERIADFDLSDSQRLVFAAESGIYFLDNNGDKRVIEARLTDESVNSVAFTNSGVGIATGDSGLLMYSRDGGTSWSRIPVEARDNLVCAGFLDAGKALIVTEKSILRFSI